MKINWKVLLALGLIVWVLSSSQTTLVTVVVVLGSLLYMSYTTQHRWIRKLLHMGASTQDTQTPEIIGGTDSEGRALRSHNYHLDR